MDHNSRPQHSPTAISDDIADAIMELRRTEKWGAARIAAHLAEKGITVSPSTVHRTLKRNDMSRVRDMDPPTGEVARIIRYEHERPGDMVHVDIKKVGRIPTGGGWAVHGRGTDEARASKRKGKGTGRIGYAYLHSAVDDYSRFAYTEVLGDEKGETAAAFWLRAAAYFGQHGIVNIVRVLTDNGSPYRSRAFAEALTKTGTRHKRTRPYTPRTNGKVERYNQTMLAEWLRRRPYDSEQDRTQALTVFLNYYNFERKHSALGWLPPITRVPAVGPKVEPQEVEEARTGPTLLALGMFSPRSHAAMDRSDTPVAAASSFKVRPSVARARCSSSPLIPATGLRDLWTGFAIDVSESGNVRKATKIAEPGVSRSSGNPQE